MPLTRQQILDLRRRVHDQVGSGEAEWLDTSPAGLRRWARTHPTRWDWLVDSTTVSAVPTVMLGSYAKITIADKTITGSVDFAAVLHRDLNALSSAAQDPRYMLRIGVGQNVIAPLWSPMKQAVPPLERQFQAALP
jgi:hypothetical protein